MAIPEPPSIPPQIDGVEDPNITDPPPPYPTRERRARTSRAHRASNAARIQTASLHTHSTSGDSYTTESDALLSPHIDDDMRPNETTPFLVHRHHRGRPRAHSDTSTNSAAPSLTQTMLSLFMTEDDDGSDIILVDDHFSVISAQRGPGFFSFAAWKRYFRPLGVRAYYRALFHLLVINFPYGLLAWVYLFVFTVTGTILLIALPLGALLCFFDLLGARAFSRGELALQARFHAPLTHAPPYPPRPIFRRYRPPTTAELESGRVRITHSGLVREQSFYKNTYDMFRDPTSYQALFYFLVVKPAITLLISIGIVILALPAIILILPAPAALRAVRRIGKWQANVAVEGLYVAVR
ncbi:hypothetical protein BDN70DRAFT_874157 [Pholiota conissans]|uniref:Uncharacterized protein n=1 Tax=Pholiota conissans TaxID=109636 RepID=A0A9P5Z7Z4_9AGAR|nr:hypothetical protein BDN70DRAFT_874157 [Pholiota conissans]